MTAQYLEDYAVGQIYWSGRKRVVKDEIVAFAKEFDPQYYHLDEVAALKSPFKGLAASGWHTAGMTMRLMVDGEFSPAGGILGVGFDQLSWSLPVRPGDELLMRKIPKGKFTLDTESGRKHHLLVSTVTGVAPFVSFVRTLSKDWKEGRFDGSQQLYLLNGASRPWEFGYKEELHRFAAELPWFTYVPTVSRPWDHADWPGEIGRADDVLRKYADRWELDATNTTAYLCGHPDMIANSKAILKRRGFLDRTAIKEEIYWIPSK